MERYIDWGLWRRTETTFVPDGYELFREAAEILAKAHFGPSWIGGEFAFEAHHVANRTMPSPLLRYADKRGQAILDLEPRVVAAIQFWGGMAQTYPTYEEWELAYDRFRFAFINQGAILERKGEMLRVLQRLAASGDLPLMARAADGTMVSVPASCWNCEPDLAHRRFAASKINLAQPMRACPAEYKERLRWEANQTSWLFVPIDALDAAAKRLSSQRADALAVPAAPHPSSYANDDAPLVEEMQQLMAGGMSRHRAAQEVADRAKGGGDFDAKVRRLSRRHKTMFGEG